jgi:hypothetical protein
LGGDATGTDVSLQSRSLFMSAVFKRYDISSHYDPAVIVREPKLFQALTSICVDKYFEAFPADKVAIL